MKTAPDSKRWTHFHSALQLAISRSAHKWTYEDFQECFTLWCKEEPHGAEGIFNTVSRHMEDQIHQSCENLFKEFNVRDSINILHAVVSEARARKQRGEIHGKDVWRENLAPRAAVRARTVRVMESEVERARAELQALEEENAALYARCEDNDENQRAADAKTVELLDILDDVYAKWSQLPQDEIGVWALESAENVGFAQPP
ncbi:hypothetical protein DFJ58DRAFT_913997 [Suillus subalutaceus]|uniref:uncharacterized protein n=1 Tax=Suillus subalutaceus TaxID=48586 RepID=UPI001B8846E6|nr:uncharacterized protein DFJ58DRAFT_913997 [Suillus subalutaceus]KAG1854844.1 hypothetical protein DFJ58DRAFT_913997 [Suillus subalutaceus]